MKKIGIVGLGLMGGSFGRLLIKNGYEVLGFDRDEKVQEKAKLVKAISETLTEKNANELDMLVIATYPRAAADVMKKFCPLLKSDSVVIDFCGTKRAVVKAMKEELKAFPSLKFVGGHPMAGKEFGGIEHSSVRLFDGASMILVPVTEDLFFLSNLKEFFLSLGFGGVVVTTAAEHDKMIAYTSQLCHVVSNAFIKSDTADMHAGFSAGSYRDLTRVARLNPEMWASLMQDNRDALLPELSSLIDHLIEYRDALKDGNEVQLKKLLADGDEKKRRIDKR